MVQLQKDLADIETTGTKVVGVSYDSVETLKSFSDDQSISYLLLSDEGSKTINAYGIHHQDGYAHPGTYLLDREGVVRAELFLDGYMKRHPNAELIQAAQKID